jgi:leucyl-tRNA synthetase
VEAFVLLLSPFAPHIAEEFWQLLGHDKTLAYEPWPTYDEALTHEPEVELAVQINGKIRDRVTVPADSDDEAIKQKVLESDCIKGQLEGKTVCKVIVIKNRMVNIVVS